MPERQYSVPGALNDPDALRSKIEESLLKLELSVISDDTRDTEHLVLKMIKQGKEGPKYVYEYRIVGENSSIPEGVVKIIILGDKIDLTITTS